MATKNYAVSVKYVHPFEKTYSVMGEVYGFYDAEDPSILHQIEPKLVNMWFAKDSAITPQLAPKVRLLCPALGISKQGKEIKSERKGTDLIFNLIGLHSAHVEILNMPELQEDVVKKTEVSRVMLGADAGLIERVASKAWAKLKSLV